MGIAFLGIISAALGSRLALLVGGGQGCLERKGYSCADRSRAEGWGGCGQRFGGGCDGGQGIGPLPSLLDDGVLASGDYLAVEGGVFY